MANIGTFKSVTGGGFEGVIATLTMKQKVKFVPNENPKTPDSPDYFVKSGRNDFGVAWDEVKKSDDGEPDLEYVSVKLDAPEIPTPINAALFTREDGGADLVWSRPKA